MKIAIAIFFLLHGLLHTLGFGKAFNLISSNQITHGISKGNGVVWLLTGLMFATGSVLLMIDHNFWWIIASGATILSQYLIFTIWREAKFGTVANMVAAVIIVLFVTGWLKF